MPTIQNAHALIIGIANYQNHSKLSTIVLKDAQDIYKLLTDLSYCAYLSNHVELLLDDKATKAGITKALDKLAQRCDSDSTVFFYISSHGGRIESGDYAGEYLLPVDVVNTSQESFAHSAISGIDFTKALRKTPARKMVIILDCCHSGGIGQPKGMKGSIFKTGLPEKYYDVLKAGHGKVILASSRSNEFSLLPPGATNSLFTQHLLAGLQGGIASEDGFIRIFDLFEYLQPKVTCANPNQHPVFKAELEENFPLALYLGGQKGMVPKVEPEFRYDAYISYVDKEPDTTWVWDTLVARLEGAGLKIAVSGDVAVPGVARVVNIERGIQQAKRTVIVLSENYLADNMAHFENVLGQTMGIEEGHYRLLPIKFAPIDDNQIPTRLSMLETLNLSHPRRAEREFSRLIQALQGTLPRR